MGEGSREAAKSYDDEPGYLLILQYSLRWCFVTWSESLNSVWLKVGGLSFSSATIMLTVPVLENRGKPEPTGWCTDKKDNKIFQIFFIDKEIRNGLLAKSYMRKWAMFNHEEAVSRIGRHEYDFATAPFLNFHIYEENLIFFFITVVLWGTIMPSAYSFLGIFRPVRSARLGAKIRPLSITTSFLAAFD